MKKAFDILGLGCTAVDEILYVPKYPRADSKVEVRERERHCGGLCATALVAGARLGAKCAYAGTLGDNEDSTFVQDVFHREGVDTRHIVHRPKSRPVHSMIVVDESRHTRTIFYETRDAQGADPAAPPASVIAMSRVLLVDRFGLAGMLRAARIARARHVPIVGDFESSPSTEVRELIRLTDHLIVSEEFACSCTGTKTAAKAAARLWNDDRVAVVVTAGAEGCWLRDKANESPRHIRAFPVRTIDTTGCGDVFHGAYAAALAWGWPILDRLLFASASAALKAISRGAQSGIPQRSTVLKYLDEFGYAPGAMRGCIAFSEESCSSPPKRKAP